MRYRRGLGADEKHKIFRTRLRVFNRVEQATFAYHGSSDRMRAKERALAWLHEKDCARKCLHVTTKQTLLSACMDYLAETKHRVGLGTRSEQTLVYWTQILSRLLTAFGDRHSLLFTETEVREYAIRREIGGAAAGGIKELAGLRTVLAAAGHPAVWKMPRTEAKKKISRVPPDAEVAAVFKSLGRDDLQLAFLLALLLGVRPGDVRRLTYEQVDRASRTISFDTSKTGEANVLPLVPTLYAKMAREGGGELVTLSNSAIKSALIRRSEGLGLSVKWEGLRTLRHVCATWIHEEGYSQQQVALVLAHVIPGVTRTYLHAAPVRLKTEMLGVVERRFLAALEK